MLDDCRYTDRSVAIEDIRFAVTGWIRKCQIRNRRSPRPGAGRGSSRMQTRALRHRPSILLSPLVFPPACSLLSAQLHVVAALWFSLGLGLWCRFMLGLRLRYGLRLGLRCCFAFRLRLWCSLGLWCRFVLGLRSWCGRVLGLWRCLAFRFRLRCSLGLWCCFVLRFRLRCSLGLRYCFVLGLRSWRSLWCCMFRLSLCFSLWFSRSSPLCA